MNRGGQNHVTYYEPEKKEGSERREEQRDGNIMDKGSNEAEKGEVARERRGESNVEGRGRKEARKKGGRGERAVG